MRTLRIALAGNANVGKSVLFNELTGLHQTVGNWPGKTVEKAEGKLQFEDHEIHVVDLPGIYSLSSYSIEEIVARLEEETKGKDIDAIVKAIRKEINEKVKKRYPDLFA